MALNFPSDPEVNATYEVNGIVYVWDGIKWTSKGQYSGQPLLPDIDGNVIVTGNLTVLGNSVDLSGDLSVAGDIDND